MSRLLIVSNRLPVTVKLDRGEVVVSRSAGGLASALWGPHQRLDSLWLGWPGDVSRLDGEQRARLERELSDLRAAPIYLSQADITRYYEGFSNGVLWPLFHYLTDRVEREAWQNWRTYSEVNRRFADLVVQHYQPGDLIWVHDYQLALVPDLLRQRLSDATIGFFLHIPFPSSEVFRILPWREEILKGLIGADVLGFHTYSYVRHFARSLSVLLGLDGRDETLLRCAGRDVRLGAFPLGVDAGAFSRRAEEPEVLTEVGKIRKECGDRKLLLGVDRLDYTKGIPRRMLAISRLLEREPSLRNKIRFIQIVVPSRTKVESYAVHRRRLDEMVGRINGAHGTVDSMPIHYLYRSVSERQLVALYRAADVMLVTPLRDGMNLVAKEFVASRPDEDGVLILSEFAGASAEMVEALQVNPYHIDGVAVAIKKALVMSAEERRDRMNALRRRVLSNDSYRWAGSFMDSLESARKARSIGAPGRLGDCEKLLEQARTAERLLLVLDYDGTLVPFVGSPQLAGPDSDLKALLRLLAARPSTVVTLVSGRTRETLERWFGDLPVGLHAEHGFWSKPAGGAWAPAQDLSPDWKETVMPLLEEFTLRTPGALVEEKTAALAWHYRMADPEFGPRQSVALLGRLEDAVRTLPLEVLEGEKVIEIRLKGVNKGVVVTRLLERHEPGRVIAIGDDRTDEDMFAALPADGIGVRVGLGNSVAQYRLPDVNSVRTFLTRLVEPRAEAVSADDPGERPSEARSSHGARNGQ